MACPKGHFWGPLVFLILINDLTAGCLLHKSVDDPTLSEFIRKGQLSKRILVDVCNWSRDNCININWSKTKEMLVGTVLN